MTMNRQGVPSLVTCSLRTMVFTGDFDTKFTTLHNNNSNMGLELASYKAAIGLRRSDGLGCLSLLAGIRNFLALLSVFRTIDALSSG